VLLNIFKIIVIVKFIQEKVVGIAHHMMKELLGYKVIIMILIAIEQNMYQVKNSVYKKLLKYFSEDEDKYNNLLQEIQNMNESTGVVQTFYYK
jgi:hypothetical protein